MEINFEVASISEKQIYNFKESYTKTKEEVKKRIIKILKEKYNIDIYE